MNFVSPSWSRRLCASVFPALGAVLSMPASAQQLPSQQEVIAQMNKVANYWLTTDPWKPGVASVKWTGSTLMNGFLAAYDVTGNSAYLNFAETWASHHNYALNGSDTQTFGDNYACGETYIKLYHLTGSSDPTKIQHIKSDIDFQTAQGSSGYKYFGFVDALNMGMPSFAGISVIEGNPAVAEHMYQMYLHVKTTQNSGLNLWNTTDHLWYRDSSQKNSHTYWARGDGWAFIVHAKMLQTLPTSDPHYAEYLSTFQQQAAALLTVQRPDGLWRVNLANATTYPGPEATGSACYMYGMAYGVRTGMLDRATYLPAVAKAWNGFVNVAIHPDTGEIGYIQGTGSRPSDRQPVNYNNTNGNNASDSKAGDFGYGLFLLAAAEVSKIAGTLPQAASPTFSPAPGTYANALEVALSASTANSAIHFTTDGTTPSATHGAIYSAAISIGKTTTIKAYASAPGFADSPVITATYTIAIGTGTTVSFEAESLARTSTGATTSAQSDAKSSGGQWIELAGNSVGDYVEFTTPSIAAGTYRVDLMWKGNNNRGVLNLKIDGTQSGGILDQYSAGQTYPTTSFGTLTFASVGAHTIRLTVTGKNAASSGEGLSADKFTFVAQ